ncbi:MAG: YfcC family protein, partial [Tannerellaceae bacterium]
MKKRQIPHTYVIIFYIILFCAAMTWFIPGGSYVEQLDSTGVKSLVFKSVPNVPQTWEVFASFYKGFVDKADIIVFILIIGGAFWIVNDSKAFDIGTMSFLQKAKRMERNPLLRKIGVNNFIITAIMLLFSIFGAVFGMSEETIAFIIILVPMAISMGYDSIT